MNKGTLFVISGPSGAGKSTLVLSLMERLTDFGLTDVCLSVSATTRLPRPGELDGVAYHFLSEEQFDEGVEEGLFVEWACVHGNRYGTLKYEVDKSLSAGWDLILEIDIQGGFQVKEKYPNAVLVFVEPPSLDELKRRLHVRKTESEESIKRRLETAKLELASKDRYTVSIVNDRLEDATRELAELVKSYRDVN